MTSIDGIQIEKDAKGQDAFIRIDLNKYKAQLELFLREVGLGEDNFEKEWESGLSLEEAKNKSIDKMRKWWKE